MNALSFYNEIPPMAQMTGKRMESTWWGDFRVGAELDGIKGIKDTYRRGLSLAKSDKVYGTEFSLVLNWLSWFYNDKNEYEKSKVFTELWREFHLWVVENWKGEDLTYYLKEVD